MKRSGNFGRLIYETYWISEPQSYLQIRQEKSSQLIKIVKYGLSLRRNNCLSDKCNKLVYILQQHELSCLLHIATL